MLELESMFAEDVSSHAIEGELIREELIRCKEAKVHYPFNYGDTEINMFCEFPRFGL